MIRYEMPSEVRAYVLLIQAEMKAKKGNGKLSQQHALTQIVKEHKQQREKSMRPS